MKHVWTVLSQKSSIDRISNLLSIFNCIEELSLVVDKRNGSDNSLVIPAEFQVISFWMVENPNKDNTLEVRGELLDPGGKILNKFGDKFEIKTGILRFKNITSIQGLPITDPGRYIIKLTQKKENENEFETIAELPIDVKISYKSSGILNKN